MGDYWDAINNLAGLVRWTFVDDSAWFWEQPPWQADVIGMDGDEPVLRCPDWELP